MSSLFGETLARYNATRNLAGKPFHSPCYAPFTSMYFDSLGNVTACCHSKPYPLGNITTQSLDEIWRGPRARALRQAVLNDNFKLGCHFCQWQFEAGNADGSFIRRFDHRSVLGKDPPYPTQMEFSISNACNLECVMCNGEWSSSIRSRREKLPPLPKVYGEGFFQQLREYLPHLEAALFYGGEPFLQRECFQIWDMLVEMGLEPDCWVTTNGTQYNSRIERLLERLPFSFCISMDGTTKQTVERIRVNANFERVQENVERFLEYTRRRGTQLDLTFCMMRQNWHEFGDYLLYADARDCAVHVNTVTEPPDFSLYALPSGELREVVDSLTRQESELLPQLKRNRQVWYDELARLRNHLQASREPVLHVLPAIEPILPRPERAPSDVDFCQHIRAAFHEQCQHDSDGGPVVLRLDPDGKIEASGHSADFMGIELGELAGKSLADVDLLLIRRFGERVRRIENWRYGGVNYRFFELRSPSEHWTRFRAVAIPLLRANELPAGEIWARIVGEGIGANGPPARASLAGHFVDLDRAELPLDYRVLIQESMVRFAGEPLVEIHCGLDDRMEDIQGDTTSWMGASFEPRGRSVHDLFTLLIARFGSDIRQEREWNGSWFIDRITRFAREGDATWIRTITIPRLDDEGVLRGASLYVGVTKNLPSDHFDLAPASDLVDLLAGLFFRTPAAAR